MERDLSKGDIPVMILAVVGDSPSHGYAIARAIELRSGKLFHLREGSLYPALRTLEQAGHIEGSWEIQPSGPARRVYRITRQGRTELKRRTQAWQKYADTVRTILGGTGDAQTA